MTSTSVLAVKFVFYSAADQLSSWLTGTSTVVLVLATRVRIAFAHKFFFQFLFFYNRLWLGLALGSVLIAHFNVFTMAKI